MIAISIVIPVKNGEATLKACLSAIKSQSISNQMEVIVLDSMSTDDSRKIAESFSAKIIDIPNGTFNHGLTRNLGMQNAEADLIYYTVQDAYLAESDQLERMAAYFTDQETQSVTGIQAVPNDPDKNPAIWFRRFSKPVPETRLFIKGDFQNLTPKKQLENCGWDDVNAMYRKSALETLPFQKTDFAEDALWARDALMRGWKIIRDASLVVYHYHYETFSYVFRMKFILNYAIWEHFGVLPRIPNNLKSFAQNVFTLYKKPHIPFSKKVKWIMHNALRHAAHTFSVIIFRLAYLVQRQKSLDKAYTFFCSSVPQGTQNKAFKGSKNF